MIQEVLNSFKSSLQLKTMSYQGIDWQYYTSGTGTQTILLLPGMLGTSEVLFPYFTHFSSSYRVIMPIYPNLYTMKELLQGLHILLRKEKAENVVLIGSGFGGAIAQCYMRKHPKLITHLILLHSNTMNAHIPESAFHSRIVYLAKMIKFTDLMPLAYIKSSYKKNFKSIIKSLSKDNLFWKNYLYDLANTYTKPNMNASFGRLFDFTSNYQLTSTDHEHWKGTTLLIEDTCQDSYLSIERDSLHLIYPDAFIHIEDGLASVNSLDKYETYIQVIEGFIADSSALHQVAL